MLNLHGSLCTLTVWRYGGYHHRKDNIDVNGEYASPLYTFLKKGKWGIFGDDIQWNFAKFLVDKNGQVVDCYYPTTSPLSLEHDIKKLLGIS
ncbi:hypothetical protein Patl1_17775 [Pistacia atlantica]|uniref:Uncharacterized protein n=1 Tax=Pistacia atlantica TaxID=434234 RepID=A0ACC1C1Z7_9ROSI|nr:hypothetical protein Patl1_17775 [Pistacia atlantica]